MKIFHIADSFHGGGAEAVFRDTLKASDQLGLSYTFYVSNGKRSFLSYIFSFTHFFNVCFRIFKYKPKIIHIHNYYHFLSPSILLSVRIYKAFNKDVRCVFTAHDYHLICPNSGLQYFEDGVEKNLTDTPAFSYEKILKYDYRGKKHSLLKFLQFFCNYKIFDNRKVIDLVI